MPADDMIFFSVQDLFGYWRAHVTMSGIQRVQAGIARYAIDAEGDRIGFILNDLSDERISGDFFLIDSAGFGKIIDYASGETVDHATLRLMLDACEAEAVRVRPKRGQAIVILGAFWGHGNTADQYLASRRAGVAIGVYVYDIIPVTHPEHCKADLVRDHTMSVCEMGLLADFGFTISDFTRHEWAALFARHGGRQIPMQTVPLAHSLTAHRGGAAPVPAITAWPQALRSIEGRPFVAYVSTVEGRKNHRYVVEAWQQLIEQGVAVPDLVFVGRHGWRIGGLVDLLDGTRNLGGRVHVVHDLSDAELDAIYSQAMFTVFTSFVEGWGLPIGESLVHGTPCIASSTSSMPEVGGNFVDYVDPLNLRDGVAVFRRMIEDDDYREGRRRAIRDEFKPRTWPDVGRLFLDATRAMLTREYPDRLLYPTLREGVRFEPGALVTEPIQLDDYVPGPMRLALRDSFYALEPMGAWMKGWSGTIDFLTLLEEGAPVTVYLEMLAAPGLNNGTVTVRLDGNRLTTEAPRFCNLDPNERVLVRAQGVVGPNRLCRVSIELAGTLDKRLNDTRIFGIGLVAIGYARTDDAVRRDDLMERFLFHDASVDR